MSAFDHAVDRRTSLKWMLAAAAGLAVLDRSAFASDPGHPAAVGYGTDPDLLKDYHPSDVWPLTLTESQRATAAALCDAIIPADAKSPSASAVGVPAFIDEWVSAPYPIQRHDREIVLGGLEWVEAESQRRFGSAFPSLIYAQKAAICDDICYLPKAAPKFQKAARFFKLFRDLTAAGFYTTKEGWTDIGYIGNVPLASFDGPPREVLAKLGLA